MNPHKQNVDLRMRDVWDLYRFVYAAIVSSHKKMFNSNEKKMNHATSLNSNRLKTECMLVVFIYLHLFRYVSESFDFGISSGFSISWIHNFFRRHNFSFAFMNIQTHRILSLINTMR